MLTFIDIYEKTQVAARNGDYLQVTYQVARFIRRCLDFKSMEREVRKSDIPKLTSYIKKSVPIVKDAFTQSIYVLTGFIDGGFNAQNVSHCRANLVNF